MNNRLPRDADCTREQLIEKLQRCRERSTANNISSAEQERALKKRIVDLTRAKRLANNRADKILATHKAFVEKLSSLTLENL